jgi:UDP-GlcNAc:undecaprenyl-phosphate GlcNAc-1-phosphate transferase
MIYVGIASLLVAMGVTWMATPGVIRLAGWLGAIDLPGGRKTHSSPVPRIGGLAVYLGFLAGMAFAAFATGNLLTIPQTGVYWRGLAFAASGLLVIGLIDDLSGLRYYWKFAAQILAAIYVWNCGFRIETISHPLGAGQLDLELLSFPLTLLWIVGITNAVNLIDGLDGLAAGIALITTVAVAVIALARGQLGVTAAAVALAGSLIGFLRFNFNPARIFLGDSGSMFLGFVLAVTSVRGSQKGPTAVAILVPLLVLGLPLVDTGLAVVRRLIRLSREGRSEENGIRYMLGNLNQVFLPDRGHIHHRLVDLGLSQRGAVLTLYVVGLLFACAAFALVLLKSLFIASLLLGVLILLMASFLLLVYLRIRRPGLIAENMKKTDNSAATAADPLTSTTGRLQSR